MFDQLNYFRTQGLLDERAWEFIACEIHNLALNSSVWEYMRYYQNQYREKDFPEDIIPFTGLFDLFSDPPDKFSKLPDNFKIKGFSPQLKKRFEKLSQ